MDGDEGKGDFGGEVVGKGDWVVGVGFIAEWRGFGW